MSKENFKSCFTKPTALVKVFPHINNEKLMCRLHHSDPFCNHISYKLVNSNSSSVKGVIRQFIEFLVFVLDIDQCFEISHYYFVEMT